MIQEQELCATPRHAVILNDECQLPPSLTEVTLPQSEPMCFESSLTTRASDDSRDAIAKIPVELMAETFGKFVSGNMDKDFAVDSVTDTKPKLWTSMSVNICSDQPDLPDLVSDWLNRSKELELPLCIHIYADELSDQEPDSAVELLEAIAAHSERWVSFSAHVPPHYMRRIGYATTNFKNLKNLELCLEGGDFRDASWGITVGKDTPVQRLSLFNINLSMIQINWSSLTTLETNTCMTDHTQCYHLFRKAPFLQHCTLHWTCPPDVPESRSDHPACTMNNLTYLRICGDYVGRIFEYLKLPALSHLEIYVRYLDRRLSDLFLLRTSLRRASQSGSKRTIRVVITGPYSRCERKLIPFLQSGSGLTVDNIISTPKGSDDEDDALEFSIHHN
ncbi:hypothetical protein BDN70DRAFT_936242 [Pholiota conissans]|uniref:Uncharacterized protein n=1 Tax=Pholiota conissans TaxID=109636 RepID=A0A9P5YSG7_9AGAR|nr:hypothetical protein BDN70DRAFT_936242 [Pholiota conissans]